MTKATLNGRPAQMFKRRDRGSIHQMFTFVHAEKFSHRTLPPTIGKWTLEVKFVDQTSFEWKRLDQIASIYVFLRGRFSII